MTCAPQMGVHQFVFPGVITLADGQFEAVLLYLYVKGLREGGSTTFRGFLFAQSAERAWYNWGETGLCQPYVAKAWLPRVYLRCAPRAAAGCGALRGRAGPERWGARRGREVWREGAGAEKREYDFRVFKELMFGEARSPAQPLAGPVHLCVLPPCGRASQGHSCASCEQRPHLT